MATNIKVEMETFADYMLTNKATINKAFKEFKFDYLTIEKCQGWKEWDVTKRFKLWLDGMVNAQPSDVYKVRGNIRNEDCEICKKKKAIYWVEYYGWKVYALNNGMYCENCLQPHMQECIQNWDDGEALENATGESVKDFFIGKDEIIVRMEEQ